MTTLSVFAKIPVPVTNPEKLARGFSTPEVAHWVVKLRKGFPVEARFRCGSRVGPLHRVQFLPNGEVHFPDHYHDDVSIVLQMLGQPDWPTCGDIVMALNAPQDAAKEVCREFLRKKRTVPQWSRLGYHLIAFGANLRPTLTEAMPAMETVGVLA